MSANYIVYCKPLVPSSLYTSNWKWKAKWISLQSSKYATPVMLNYARDAGDGRRRLTIVSRLAGRRPTAAIWRHIRGGNYIIAHRWRRGGALAYEA